MKILALYGSPRKDGNTDILLDEFLRGAESAGATVTKKYLRDMHIQPCTECGLCDESGECIYDDDYQAVFNMIPDIDIMIVASPIFFYGVPAIVKAFIDRSQQFWIGKYKLDTCKDVSDENRKKGYFLSVGATQGKKIFDGPLLNFRYFYDALNLTFEDSFFYRGLDEKGAASKHQELLKDCFSNGAKVVNSK